MDSEELDRLILAARSDGGWAFGRLWEVLSPKVCGYVRGRGAADPEDLTSTVFLDAFRGLDRFDGDGSAFKRWLFTIAHRRLVDELRARARRGVPEPYEGQDDPRISDSAETVAMKRLSVDTVQRRLEGLSDDQRDVLMLRILGEMSLEEVATAMNKSVNAVKGLQKRALATLRSTETSRCDSPWRPASITESR